MGEVTVGELIEKLQKCPPAAHVLTSDSEFGHDDDPDVWLMDAFFGPTYPGGPGRLITEEWHMRDWEPNCKAVVISHFEEHGEQL